MQEKTSIINYYFLTISSKHYADKNESAVFAGTATAATEYQGNYYR
jgi:hypothetical protein